MRPHFLRVRSAIAAFGALFTIAIALAVSPITAQTDAQGTALTAKVAQKTVRYGTSVVVSGKLASGEQDRTLALELRPRGGAWQRLATTKTGAGGAYRVAAPLRRAGEVRVTVADADGGAAVARAGTAASSGTASPSAPVAMAADLRARTVRAHVVAGHRATVRGVLRPAGRGAVVTLQRRGHGGWTTVARDQTDARGAFQLRFTPRRPSSSVMRVRFGGDAKAGAARDRVGRLNVYRRAMASWYGPGFYGQKLGCGGRLGANEMGVANKTLPCGSKLTLRYRGRSVRVRVIDRGPYSGGREFDLTAATKRALGFGSTGYVLTTR